MPVLLHSIFICREIRSVLLQYVCSGFVVLVVMEMNVFFIAFVLLWITVCNETLIKWYLNKCRVTCRDWFQLSLKEGLTVFRDQVELFCFLYNEWQFHSHISTFFIYSWKSFNIARSFHLIWEAALWRGSMMFQSFEFLSSQRFFLVPFHNLWSDVLSINLQVFKLLSQL